MAVECYSEFAIDVVVAVVVAAAAAVAAALTIVDGDVVVGEFEPTAHWT